MLDAQPLALRVFDGTATLRGRADFRDPDNATLRFAVNARGLNGAGRRRRRSHRRRRRAIRRRSSPTPTSASPARCRHWAAIGKRHAHPRRRTRAGAVRRPWQRCAHDAEVAARADAQPAHSMRSGDVALGPGAGLGPQCHARRLRSGLLRPGMARARCAAGSPRAASRATTAASTSPSMRRRLDGRLRGRPLQGRGHFLMHGAATATGAGRLRRRRRADARRQPHRRQGQGGATRSMSMRSFAPLQLNDLLPDGAGTLRGTLEADRRPHGAEHRCRPHRQRPELRRLSRRQRSARRAACRGAAAAASSRSAPAASTSARRSKR